MIAHLCGTLTSASPCVVDVGGVGFEVQIPEKDRASLLDTSGEVSFHTYLYVREDRLELFGFVSVRDRTLFMRLIDVSGIGPRIALGILGEASGDRIARAVREKDIGFLCKLPGIGRKTAERLAMELKDKLAEFHDTARSEREGASPALREEAVLALTTLGMTRAQADLALEKIDWQSEDASSVEKIVKRALKSTSAV